MSQSPHDAIIICLDIGKSVSTLNTWESETFFNRSKECLSWIIQRKLISQSLDVLSLILIGSDDTDNSLASSGYKNIACKFDFQYSSWEMLKFIEKDVETTEEKSDWIGALVVAIEMLKVYEEFNSVRNKKIIFFSDFTHPASDDLEVITKNLKKLDIGITIIGLENISHLIEEEEQQEPFTKKQRIHNNTTEERLKGEESVFQFWKMLPDSVIICSFEGALKQLCSYTRKASRKTPWNCILDISDVKINISMYKKTDPKNLKKFETKFVKMNEKEPDLYSEILPSQVSAEDIVPVIRDKVMHYKHEGGENSEAFDVEVQEEDTIVGFRYGNTIIPFTDADKKVMAFKSGPKSFSIIGFTNISLVPFYLLTGEGSYVVLPRNKDQNAEVAFSAIVQAMKRMECLAIVRRVYSNDRGLSLGVLYPFVEEISGDSSDDEIIYKECLIYIELAFDEEVKSVSFPSLENFAKNITEDQYDTIDELIDNMNLMSADKGIAGEPCEAFDSTSLHDFKEQFYHYCVIQRGLYPEKPLPKNPPYYIENYIRVPKLIEEKHKVCMNKIKEKFKIKEIKPGDQDKNEAVAGPSTIAQNTAHFGNDKTRMENEVCHFSTLSINEEKNSLKKDWLKLFARGFPTDKELEDCLIGNNSKEMFSDVFERVRNLYLKENPDRFNWWMGKFKSFCYAKSGFAAELWSVVVKNNWGLISNVENKFSRVTEAEAEDFLHFEPTKSLSYNSSSEKSVKCDIDLFQVDKLDELIKEQMVAEELF